MNEEKTKRFLGMLPAQKKIAALWSHQEECIEAIMRQKLGTHQLVVMATGLGKTATFCSLPDRVKANKMLIVAAGKEIVTNPLAYFPVKDVGLEMGEFHYHKDFPNARYVAASVQSLTRRLDEYEPDEFDIVIIDEAHHSAAPTYRRIIEYFKPRLYLLGFTATPKRTDGIQLADLYEGICFQRDLIWGIKNKMLSDIYPRNIRINVNLRNMKMVQNAMGETDFDIHELARRMAKSAPAIIDIYKKYAVGPTIIVVSSVKLAYEIANAIPEAVAVTGEMPVQQRAAILQHFNELKVRTLVAVDVLKEGVDVPPCETFIFARPTKSLLVFIQNVGRGTRISPKTGKKFLNLIIIEGIMDDGVSLVQPMDLLGIDAKSLPEHQKAALEGKRISEYEDSLDMLCDEPAAWIGNAETVALWSENTGFNLHNVRWFMFPDGRFELYIRRRDPMTGYSRQMKATIPPPDALGRVVIDGVRIPQQLAFDLFAEKLNKEFNDCRSIWDKTKAEKWSGNPISPEQERLIHSLMPDYETEGLTKKDADLIITRLMAKDEVKKQKPTWPIHLFFPGQPAPLGGSYTVGEAQVKGQTVAVQDFHPGVQFPLDAESKKLEEEFMGYLRACVRTVRTDGCDVDQLIERINKAPKSRYLSKFVENWRPRYRYLCSIDGVGMSRLEMTRVFARMADDAMPRIIYADVLHPENNIHPSKAKVKLTEEPMDKIEFEFPETAKLFEKKRRRLLVSDRAIKNEAMEKYLLKQQNEPTKKKASKTAKKGKKK